MTASGPTGNTGSVSDTLGNTFTKDTNFQVGIVGHYSATLWYACNSSAGADSITFTYGAGDAHSYTIVLASHIAGLQASCHDVSTIWGAGQTSSFTSSTCTTTNAHDLVLSPIFNLAGNAPTITPSGGATVVASGKESGNGNSLAFEYLSQTSTGSYTLSGTFATGTILAGCAAFKGN